MDVMQFLLLCSGLYKQLATLKDLLAEYREDASNATALKAPIISNLNATGLQDDCPFVPATAATAIGGTGEAVEKVVLSPEDADSVDDEVMMR